MKKLLILLLLVFCTLVSFAQNNPPIICETTELSIPEENKYTVYETDSTNKVLDYNKIYYLRFKGTKLPYWLMQCKNLQVLDVWLYQYCPLPDSLKYLKKLINVVIEGGGIYKEVPAVLFKIPNIEKITLIKPGSSRFPKKMHSKTLKYLSIIGSHFDSLPQQLHQLENLCSLDIFSYKCNKIPEHLKKHKSIAYISLDFGGRRELFLRKGLKLNKKTNRIEYDN